MVIPTWYQTYGICDEGSLMIQFNGQARGLGRQRAAVLDAEIVFAATVATGHLTTSRELAAGEVHHQEICS